MAELEVDNRATPEWFVRPSDVGIASLFHYEPFVADHLITTLRDQRVHCPSFANLNDPWDGKPSLDTRRLSDPAYAMEAVAWLESLNPTPDLEPWIAAIIRFELLNIPSERRAYFNRMSDLFPQTAKERWRIYCLSARPDSVLMWSLYAKHHKGICLEFDTTSNDLFANALRVIYRSAYPSWSPSQKGFGDVSALLTKSDDWAYEEEYRLIARTSDTTPGQPSLFPVGDGEFIALPSNSLKSVIAG